MAVRGPHNAKNPLAELRVSKRLTLQEVADRIGVTRQSVSYWETGRHEPSASYAAAYARAVGVDLADVIEALNAQDAA